MRTLALLSLPLLMLPTAAQTSSHPTGPRLTPPTLASVAPLGIARGMTVEMTVEGLNLGRASAIHFSHPGVKGRILRVKELPDLPDIRLGAAGTPSTIDLGPLPPRNQVTIEVEVDPETEVGPVSFRLITPQGSSPEGRFLVEPFYGEAAEREPNNTAETAVEAFLPAIFAGAVSRPGDMDYFKIRVQAGEQIVFENQASSLGSTLQPLVGIYDESLILRKEFGNQGGMSGQRFAYTFDKPGVWYLRISDYEKSGRASAFYRVLAGKFPVVTSAWPLGIQRGKTAQIRLSGDNLGDAPLTVSGTPSTEDPSAVLLRPKAGSGLAFNRVRLALGEEPELDASPAALDRGSAPLLQWPVTVNGRLEKLHYFRFQARKAAPVVLEVAARRFGSELDSVIDIFDSEGKPVPVAAARAVWETFTVLSERDSSSRGIRIQNWDPLAIGDYVMIGGEIIRLEALPKGPDEDTFFEAFGGQRITYFGTTAEAHGLDKPVYKVQMHPPGAKFAPNGLPLVTLYARNDDGGPGFGKDSYLVFHPPADGIYTVALQDIRGKYGPEMTYRLTVRSPRPDFRLSVNPRNPNVPTGGSVPVTVTASRMDGFDGPIEVSLENLPAGLRAGKGVIPPGQASTTVILSAAPDAVLTALAPLNVVGRANLGGATLARTANPEDLTKLIALAPNPDIQMSAETREVVLEPGTRAEVFVRVARQNGFAGRVPVEVRNLPPPVRVLDVGLNGVLLNEDETRRSFTLEALPTAAPTEQWIYISGQVETRSPQQNSYAAETPVKLIVKPGKPLSKTSSGVVAAGAR